jgi:uncharacterized integral membrane protein (TIGR00698 family)
MKYCYFFILIIVVLAIVFNFLTAAMTLLLGIVFGLLGTFDQKTTEKSLPLQKVLLQTSVIGLGFGVNATQALEVGFHGIYISLITILCTFALAFSLKWFLGSERKLTLLIASGTAICGGSAIAAVSPVIKANAAQTSVALAVVFVLNAIALLIFPPIGHFLELGDTQFGIWCALAIHDTSSVIGASQAFSEESMLIATTAKLVRAFWIVPLVLIISLGSGFNKKSSFPWFMVGFVAAVLLSSYLPEISTISTWIVWVARKLLIFTLFLVGMQITVSKLKQLGIKSFLIGSITWIILSIMSLLYVIYMI